MQVYSSTSGGLIEPVRLFADADLAALVNEEGILLGLPENRRLGKLYGDIIFVGVDGEAFTGLRPEQVEALQRQFGRGK